MSRVHLGKDLKVDATGLATRVVAALGIRGSGKSNTMAVIAEDLLKANVPVIIIDYVGIWFSLRLRPDGKTPSRYKIPVLGGVHGDISMLPTAGSLVAEALALNASSAVLDVSSFTKKDRCRFAADFAETFFQVKKSHPGPVFLILEEAQRFVPQKLIKGQERMLGAFEEIAETGRNYGIGLGLISLRPQKINKDVLNLTELLFAFQANGVHERKAISDWVQEKGAEGRSEVNNELPSLAEGTALVWSPSWLRTYGRYRLRMKTTYDAGATPIKARASVKTRPLDLAKLESSMATVVEQAKENDPRALKAEIARLRRELKGKPGVRPEPVEVEVVVREPFVPAEVVQEAHALADKAEKAKQAAQAATSAATHLRRLIDEVPAARQQVRRATRRVPPPRPVTPPLAAPAPDSVAPASNGEHIPKGARNMLHALATSYRALTRRQVATLAGMKSSGGTFARYMSLLKTGEYVVVDGQSLKLTEKGARAAGPVGAPMEGQALLDYWCSKLPGKTKDLLRYIVERGPIGRAEWAAAVGVESSGGTFARYLSILVTRGLVEKERPGYYRRSVLFDE